MKIFVFSKIKYDCLTLIQTYESYCHCWGRYTTTDRC